MQFNKKTIWITGASSGIGKAVALKISEEKSHLILSGRNKEELENVALVCKQNGSKTTVVPFDLGDEKSVEEAANKVFSKDINIDALYHFGGISQRSFVSETPLFVDRRIFEINYFGTIALTKAILPKMIQRGGGHLAVTSSIVGKFGFPYRSSYSASKHALHGFFESLRAENVQNNIKVSIIIPGRIKTNISINAINKEGKTHATMDDGQGNGMSAEKSAEIICKKLKREKKEILVGGKEIIMVYIRRFLPFLYYRLSSRVKPL
ncbi:SDR family NAD(P)-dependent oxidoreductase [Maribellus comscasis]|uniref:SDR family NAD(P)-dependent oxidoreductase n=1 Tax=Maribellus comscasis TaxID=2681766 RepID=A0A6I6K138_9BACT|nr:SDR family NAD(P)-dependent oxidoreductase [Maribellus comscasis]QGY47148.1 SDR family NAD(P)-dependent oxidoreductase [Maribellus comscasis]